MKKVALLVFFVLCFASVIGGKLYWNHKIERVKAASLAQSKQDSARLQDLSTDDSDQHSFEKKLAKLPESVKKAAEKANQNNGHVQIVMIGGKNEQKLAAQLQRTFDNRFGESLFSVTAKTIDRLNSLDTMKKSADLLKPAQGSPDLVLYTPPIYTDDRSVSTGDTQTVVRLIDEQLSKKYKHAAFFLNPPNYSSRLPYMNERIDELTAKAASQKISVIKYLSEWPKKAKRADVVAADGHTMTKSGQKIWLDSITKQWGLK